MKTMRTNIAVCKARISGDECDHMFDFDVHFLRKKLPGICPHEVQVYFVVSGKSDLKKENVVDKYRKLIGWDHPEEVSVRFERAYKQSNLEPAAKSCFVLIEDCREEYEIELLTPSSSAKIWVSYMSFSLSTFLKMNGRGSLKVEGVWETDMYIQKFPEEGCQETESGSSRIRLRSTNANAADDHQEINVGIFHEEGIPMFIDEFRCTYLGLSLIHI